MDTMSVIAGRFIVAIITIGMLKCNSLHNDVFCLRRD
jgi:hypothetical protein